MALYVYLIDYYANYGRLVDSQLKKIAEQSQKYHTKTANYPAFGKAIFLAIIFQFLTKIRL